MLYQPLARNSGPAVPGPEPLLAQRSLAMTLVAGARRSLDEDPVLARYYLRHLEALFHAEAGMDAGSADKREQALIPCGIPDRPARSKGGLASWQERRALEHIDANLAGPVLAEDLAALVGLSVGHFTRAFKATTGETPHVFLVRQRIRRAQILMLETNEPLARIASACGLTDQAHLARLFRAAVGTTPTSWRRARQQPLPR